MSIFSENIKALRKRKGLSQAEVAEHLEMTKQGYSLYELGKREPDFNTLKALAEFFNTDIDFLLSEYDSVSISDSKLKFALFGDTEIDDEVLDDVKRLAMEHLKYRQKNGKK
ncbi:MAG: helix-turn-helix transcriptional regulator [Ruminiclostridium sp.]|nr:helix-turn-helix transcriptional regulator [Ruminiclostridium sp.]